MSLMTLPAYAANLTGWPYVRSVVLRSSARKFACLVCGDQAAGWDHCHDHGTIRGPMCTPCNSVMASVDRGINCTWTRSSLAKWDFVGYRLAQCSECRPITEATSERIEWMTAYRASHVRAAVTRTGRRDPSSVPLACWICPVARAVCGIVPAP